MVPGGIELFGPDAALLGLVGFKKVQRQVPRVAAGRRAGSFSPLRARSPGWP